MSKAITIRIDDDTKLQAEATLKEIGLNMSTYINSSLKALIREKSVPFELRTVQKSNSEYLEKLDIAIEEARNGEAYQYFGKGKFSETPHRVDV
ncbi:MAG: type II toxin-antitoxin system RelB/DinJ family antitoxin [Defluviitaleaceae bacterium]|nr:type II toxin-antitoxin system RelB/DinJ family antitoxin [Defluviitaleaceae bacterium]